MAEVRKATTLDDALGQLAADPAARPLAAGVGILLRRALEGGGLGAALPPSGRWIDVRSLPELGGIRPIKRGRCRVGAAVTIEELAATPAAGSVTPAAPASVPAILRVAAQAVGNPGVRAAGTVGGNLVGSGTSSDLMAVLVALGAVAVVLGSAGERRVPVARVPRLFGVDPAATGGGRTTGLLLGVEFDTADPAGWGFERVTFQGRMDRAAATVAAVVSQARTGARAGRGRGTRPAGEPGDATIRVRIAATSVADRAIRFRGTERRLAAEPGIEARELEAAAAADLAGVRIRSDLRVSDWYRRAVVAVLVRRAMEAALAGSAASGPA